MHTIKLAAKSKIQTQIYKTKSVPFTKSFEPNLLNQIFQTKFTKPNLKTQIYKIKFTYHHAWNVKNGIYKTKFFLSNLQNEIHQTSFTTPNLEKPNLQKI